MFVGVAVSVSVEVGVGELVGVFVGVFVTVGVFVNVLVGVGVASKIQFVLFPESTLFVPAALIADALTLFESFTSRKLIVRVPCGSIFH